MEGPTFGTAVAVEERHLTRQVKWLERALETLGIQRERIQYSARHLQYRSVEYYYCSAVVARHPTTPEFGGTSVDGVGLTLATAVQTVARKLLRSLLYEHRSVFASTSLKLFPRHSLQPYDPAHVLQEMEEAPFLEMDGTLQTTGLYLLDVDIYASRVEAELDSLVQQFCLTARHALRLEEQNRSLIHDVGQLEAGMARKEAVNRALQADYYELIRSQRGADTRELQAELETAKLREERDHLQRVVREQEAELRRARLRLESQSEMLEMRARMAECHEREVTRLKRISAYNSVNFAHLTRTAVYLKDKASRLERAWRDSDSLRVEEIQDTRARVPLTELARLPEIQREDFSIPPSGYQFHLRPLETLPLPVMTGEVKKALETLDPIYTQEHSVLDRLVVNYRDPHPDEV
jgi:hypothetical protein